MKRFKSTSELLKLREDILSGRKLSDNADPTPGKIRIRVHMGTSGIASGALDVYNFLVAELEKRNIDGTVVRTGDMGYSFAEPTIEVTRAGEEPVVFGNVNTFKADEIIEKFIRNGELTEGIIPSNYRTVSI